MCKLVGVIEDVLIGGCLIGYVDRAWWSRHVTSRHLVLVDGAQLSPCQRVCHHLALGGAAVVASPPRRTRAHIRRRAVSLVGAAVAPLASRGLGKVGASGVEPALCAHGHGAVGARPALL